MRVSSGRAVDVGDRNAIAAYRKRMSATAWVEAAFVYNVLVPEIGFAHDYVRDSIARVRPMPAILSDNPDEAPIPLDQDSAPDGLDPDLCDQLVQRLQPFPAFMGRAAQLQDISGEVYCVLLPDDDAITGETLRVLSSRELLTQGDEWRIRSSPSDTSGVLIPANAPMWRIWTPDPEFSDLPYSHMIRLNTSCKALLAGERLINAFFLSRLATTGKILAIADEFSLESAANDFQVGTEDAGDGEGGTDTFFDDFTASGAAAIMDPESAAAVMNMIVRGPHDLIKDGISVIDISRTMEDTMAKLRTELREEIATGLNLPREIILGIGATNHWNAEEIKQQAWLNHLEPRSYNILDATTTAYYQPALLANDVDPDIVRRCVLWSDPTWFLGEPDSAESADYGYDNFLISGEAWRARKNFSPDDAPDQDEIDFRILTTQRLNVRTTLRTDPADPDYVPPTVEPGDTPDPDPNPDDNPAAPPSPKEPAPVPDTPDVSAPAPNEAPSTNGKPPKKKVAAALETADGARYILVSPDVPLVTSVDNGTEGTDLVVASSRKTTKLAALGDKQVAIERDLRTRLLEAANGTVGRALEVAGLKVKMKLGRKGERGRAVLSQLDGTRPADVPSVVGRATIEAFGLKDQELLAGAMGDLEVRYRSLVKRAQHAALAAAAQATGDEPDYDALDERVQANRDAGWTILAAGLTGLAATALYNPHPQAPDIGEYDGTSVVPPGLVRAALDAAGGAKMGAPSTVRGAEIPASQSANESSQDVSGGATAGPDMLGEFYDQLGISADGYVWVYGDAPRKEFPPHNDLDGVSFADFEDDVLANPGDWPDVDYLRPGDHGGCACDLSVSYTQGDDTTTLDPGLGVDIPDQLTRTEKADALDAPRRGRS